MCCWRWFLYFPGFPLVFQHNSLELIPAVFVRWGWIVCVKWRCMVWGKEEYMVCDVAVFTHWMTSVCTWTDHSPWWAPAFSIRKNLPKIPEKKLLNHFSYRNCSWRCFALVAAALEQICHHFQPEGWCWISCSGHLIFLCVSVFSCLPLWVFFLSIPLGCESLWAWTMWLIWAVFSSMINS